jgi:hypothetical protein
VIPYGRLILEAAMDAMRDLGSFGDERLKKGALISSRRWSINGRRVSGGWVAGEVDKYDLAASCIILR